MRVSWHDVLSVVVVLQLLVLVVANAELPLAARVIGVVLAAGVVVLRLWQVKA